jgi:hypothetical protein
MYARAFLHFLYVFLTVQSRFSIPEGAVSRPNTPFLTVFRRFSQPVCFLWTHVKIGDDAFGRG